MSEEIIGRRRKRERKYVTIENSMFEDARLSWKAKGLLGYLLSRPDGWKVQRSDLIKRSTDGDRAIRSALKELRTFGYLTMRRSKKKDGTFGPTLWEWDDVPAFETCEHYDMTDVDLFENEEKDAVESGSNGTDGKSANNAQHHGTTDVEPNVQNAHVENAHVENAHVQNHTDINNTDFNNTDFNNKDFNKTPPTPQGKREGTQKIQYAEFVKMTENEYNALTEQYGKFQTDGMIEILDDYKGAVGKTYKSDYRAIKSWVVKRWNEQNGGKHHGKNQNAEKLAREANLGF